MQRGSTPDNGLLFFCCFPGSLCGGLAPLADGLGGHAIAAGQNTRARTNGDSEIE